MNREVGQLPACDGRGSDDRAASSVAVVRADDVAEANSWGPSRFYPLGAHFGYGFRAVAGDWGRAELISVTAPCLIEHVDADRVLYVPLGRGQEPVVWGQVVSHASLLPLPAGREVAARIPGPTRYASITLPGPANPIDEELDGRAVVPDAGALARLQHMLRALFHAVDVDAGPAAREAVGEAIADALYQATWRTWAGRSEALADPAAEVVAAAMAAVREGRARSVSDMCASSAVSRSSLYRAFDTVLGLSPYSWLQVHRLTALRTALLHRAPEAGAVSQEAAAVGAFHLGNLARQYRSFFGETPVQTLRRRPSGAHSAVTQL